jgi:hypothetical protein
MRSGELSLTNGSSRSQPGRRQLWPRGRRFWLLLGALLIALASVIKVTVIAPRVAVRWAEEVDASQRLARERRYDLRNGQAGDGPEWRYELHDWSRGNIDALVHDPAVADTSYIDRGTLTVDQPDVQITVRPLPFQLDLGLEFRDLWQLFQLQSLCLLLGGGALLLSARITAERRRRHMTIATLLLVAAAAYAFPIEPSFLRMGDANTYTASQAAFEEYAGLRHVRYEAHLSHAILGRLYGLFGRTAEAPDQSLNLLMRGATAWFIACALGIGFVERWSPLVVRYLGLSLLAPSALLYFGYRELGHLSLNVAAYPLIARGLQQGSARLEAGSALFGLGAALHGFGLVSLAGSWIAAFASRGRLAERFQLALRIAAWGTAAYVGWIAVYVVVLKLPVVAGHANAIPWRPWLVDHFSVADDRVNVAILSATGARDLLFSAWVVGAPLLAVAAAMWRQYRDELRVASCYAVPSTILLICFWPIQGIGVEMDLLVAAFPALYALAWVCAHDPRRTRVAAALLVSSHVAFWLIVLDGRFVN